MRLIRIFIKAKMPLFSGAKNGNLTNIRIELMTWLKAVQQFRVTDSDSMIMNIEREATTM